MIVVSDSTPLIHLSAVSGLHLLQRLFGTVTIPTAVLDEVATFGAGRRGSREVTAAVGAWITVEPWTSTPRTHRIMEQQRLQTGEAHAIELAKAIPADIVLLDEQRAVEFARSLGLTVARTGGLYVAAKQAGLIPTVRPRLDALRAAGFWLKERDYLAILNASGEVGSV